ncbi:MAG: hypothetical protein KDN20_06110 [Verrucomicrobiae bacterium]|nr:hypothetical protein [Verrucomicrobiae bacterium]
MPEPREALRRDDKAVPEPQVALRRDNQAVPEGRVALRRDNKAVPEGRVALRRDNKAVPESRVPLRRDCNSLRESVVRQIGLNGMDFDPEIASAGALYRWTRNFHRRNCWSTEWKPAERRLGEIPTRFVIQEFPEVKKAVPRYLPSWELGD